MTTQVCLTVDVEFDIAGTFMEPDRLRPVGRESVLCSVDGSDQGLGFILRTLESHGFHGVFFIETLNTCYFGEGPMGEIAREIAGRGHDVGLHLHPVWTLFLDPNWKELARRQPIGASVHDSMAALDSAKVKELIERGLDTFSRWGLPPPSAVRAGSLMAGRNIYRTMFELDLHLASNVGFAIYLPKDASLQLYGGRHIIDGVMELPVTSFVDWGRGRLTHWKLLTVTGVAAPETRALLRSARRSGVSPVVLLTHASEYFERPWVNGGTPRLNQLTRQRLLELCSYLRAHDDRFSVTTFREQSDRWRADGPTPNTKLRIPIWTALHRLVENHLWEWRIRG